ncbi:MAG: hypothetical protein ABIW50_09015 [Candidatus Limnocylindria bacterium]
MNRPMSLVAVLALATITACSGTTTTTPSAPDPTSTSSPPASATAEQSAQASVTPSSPSPTASEAAQTDALLAVELTDVRSGESFTLGELAAGNGPVLLEPMAVWCSSCRSQQHEIIGAHDLAEFTSVSLDVDLSESPDDLASYADREGFDWAFAMADASLYRLLQDRFGVASTNPPSTPLIVIEADGTVRPLEFGRGVRNASDVVAELDAG